jgi:pyrimidine-nucleoside phosphorylase
MSFVDVIVRKRDGQVLSREDIGLFVNGVTDGTIPDYQASALLMAIVLRGMTAEETSWLTGAMVASGERLDLSDIPGVKVGKHSTGGVGDKVSLVLAPLAAACGVVVPKMSGRGLGHTGGTLDKLQSIPGFRIDLTIDEFKAVLRAVGTSIVGQTGRLAPADKKLYALRDVTGTVESLPLICASIMSKKLAEGSNALVLDVKCGDGAMMPDLPAARELARSMVAIALAGGVRAEAVITEMDVPLGRAVGNAIEVAESIRTLAGNGPQDLCDVVIHLAVRMVVLSGVETNADAAERRVRDALTSGRALQTFARMVEHQGGDPRVAEDVRLLPAVSGRRLFTAARDGYVTACRARAVGRAANALGAGRARVEDAVDHAVGIDVLVKSGDAITAGQPLLELHHRDGRGLDEALALCGDAILIGDQPPLVPRGIILDEVR